MWGAVMYIGYGMLCWEEELMKIIHYEKNYIIGLSFDISSQFEFNGLWIRWASWACHVVYMLDVSVEGGMLGLFQQNSPVMKKGVEGILNVCSGGSECAEMAS